MLLQQLLLQLILILLNAFFAATEIALLSVNEKKVRAMADEGDKKAKKLIKIIDDPGSYMPAFRAIVVVLSVCASVTAFCFSESLRSANILSRQRSASSNCSLSYYSNPKKIYFPVQ